MRGNIALVSLLTAGLLVSANPATGEPAPLSAANLPEEVAGGVIIDLPDGDRFKATVSRDQRTVWGSRYDAATRSWSARSIVSKQKNLFCGDVDGRAAGTGMALIALCDKGGYSEDQAPVHSQALYSPDGNAWQTFTLPGEAYEEPGISSDGANAIWPLHEGWVSRTTAGYSVVEHALPGQEYTITGTISDAGDVSLLYGDGEIDGRDCGLSVLTVAATGAESEQHFDLNNACADVGLANVDANTAIFGSIDYPESTVTISRPDTASPWAVTGIAPVNAPGLIRNRGRGTAGTAFVSSPGLPLLAVGSVDRHAFTAQSYDPIAQRWAEPVAIASMAGECNWGDEFIQEPLGVFALRLKCGKQRRVLISTDARTWHDVPLSRAPFSASPDGSYVAVSNAKRTLIFSRERGFVRLPLPTRATCDVIQPVSPDSAIRLTSVSKPGWPGRLDLSTSKGWQRTKTEFPRLHEGTNPCLEAEAVLYDRPISYSFHSKDRAVELAVVPHGDGFKITRTVY